MTDTITVTGNVATEPEHKRTPAGVAITTFRVASGQRRYDRTASTWVDSGTNWYTVSTFRNLADHAFRSLHKGDRVVLTGRLRLREWESGSKKGMTAEIEAEAIGHDLLWGTSRFEKRAVAAAAGSSGEASEWPTASPGDGWAVPGAPGPLEPALASAPSGEPGDALAVPPDAATPF